MNRNREFTVIAVVFMALFVLLIVYFVYFQLAKSASFISSSYNPRLDLYAEHVTRGDIVTTDGVTVATTQTDSDGEEERVYPYSNMFAHAVGYTTNGKSGIESQYNYNLLQSHSFIGTQIINSLRSEKNQGDTVVTTLSFSIQEAAYNALGSNDGAVVVLDADTGAILAMVSKPDYDPNTLASEWDSIVADEDNSQLLNRVTNGLYPPGSVFKIVTTLEYMHENDSVSSFSYDCTGSITAGDTTIHCYNGSVHGMQSLIEAFANSCNNAYASIGLSLDTDSLSSLCKKLLFNKTLPTKLSSTAKSQFSLDADDGDGMIMQTAIGQGETMVSPLHMAMLAAAIANQGVVMEPYLVDHIENDNGVVVTSNDPEEYGSIMSKKDAKRLRKYMKAVVSEGTASALSGASYTAAGKTGSAEYNSDGDSHGWFVGYASEGDKTYAIAVIVEDGGSGSSSAVPVAKAVFDAAFD